MSMITGDWQEALSDEFRKDYYKKLYTFVKEEYNSCVVYPPADDIFNAFHFTPLKSVKVLILGQDPYHNVNQAHGLSFSVLPEQKEIPPSLQNIYKELEADLGVPAAKSGDLTSWAQQGVFLLNTVLSVRAHAANSHKDFGWQSFTDAVIAALAELPQPVAFVLWGAQAQKKAALVEKSPYPRLVLQSPHPSPLSAYRGFFGSRPFSQINAFLVSYGFSPVDWKIPEDAQKHSPEG